MVNVYTCIVSGAEMISDSFDFKLDPATGCYTLTTEMVIDDPDAEVTTKVPNVAKAFRYSKTKYTKKEFALYLKSYMGKIAPHVKETNEAEMANFKKGAMGLLKFVSKSKKADCVEYWMNEEGDATGCIAVSAWPESDAAPTFRIFSYGLKMTKN